MKDIIVMNPFNYAIWIYENCEFIWNSISKGPMGPILNREANNLSLYDYVILIRYED